MKSPAKPLLDKGAVKFQWAKLTDFSALELFEIFRVRQDVFILEQNCRYYDMDEKDKSAWHLVAWDSSSQSPRMIAYCRVLAPGVSYDEISIGRVLSARTARGLGLGRLIMLEAIEQIQKVYGKNPIRISAQLYLQKFYTELDFKAVGESYLEDDIPHIEMLKN